MFYITGDTHGSFSRIALFCKENKTKREDDVMIITGDAGINYHMDVRDKEKKKKLSEIPITFFCVHGNHEQRPEELTVYKTMEFCGGSVYVEEEFPNILFAIDGEIYTFDNKEYLVVGGAYSVDKQYRMLRGYNWWDNEQPSDEVKELTEGICEAFNWNIHGVITHTCPLKYEPIEVFLSGIDQRKVDKSTEEWLDKIEDNLDYNVWYCGHYHTVKTIDKMKFMYENIKELK